MQLLSIGPAIGPVRTRGGFLNGAILVFLAEALFVPTGLITAAFLARQLGPEDYGLLTLAGAIVSWMEWAITAGTLRATVKLVGEAEDWRPIGALIARVHLFAGVGSALVLCLAAGPLALLLNEPSLESYLRLFAL